MQLKNAFFYDFFLVYVFASSNEEDRLMKWEKIAAEEYINIKDNEKEVTIDSKLDQGLEKFLIFSSFKFFY